MIPFFRQHKVFPRPILRPVPFRILLWITALEIAARFVEQLFVTLLKFNSEFTPENRPFAQKRNSSEPTIKFSERKC